MVTQSKSWINLRVNRGHGGSQQLNQEECEASLTLELGTVEPTIMYFIVKWSEAYMYEINSMVI